MATDGEKEMDSRFTCLVCLERYGGREAKLLPCSHTFCLPCLADLARRTETSQTSGLDDAEEGRQPDSLTCPTCREVIPLPPGGVTGFQRNFYLDGLRREDVAPRLEPCTLCDGDQPAQFLCGQCHNNFCSQCRRYHDRLCQGSRVTALPPPSHSSNSAAQSSMVQGTAPSATQSAALSATQSASQSAAQSTTQSGTQSQIRQQLQMVENILKRLQEEEWRLKHEKAATDKGIDIRFNTLLRHATDARDACFRSKTQACQDHMEHIHSLMEEAQQTQDTLQQQLSSSQPAPDPASTLRATLFLEGEGERILNRDLDYLLLDHRMEDNRAVLTQALQAFMGSVVSSHQASGPALSKEPAGLLPLQDHRGAMSSEEASPRNLNDLYQKVEDLAGQVTSLQSANTQLSLHVNLLSNTHNKLSTEHCVLKKEVTSVREKNDQLTSGQASLQREVTGLREKNDQLTSGQASLQREVRALRDKQAIAHQDLAVLTAEKDKACAGLAKLQTDILSMQTDASLQQTDILRLKADHGQVAAKLSAIQTEIAANKLDIAANKLDITANKSDITANKSDITANKTAVTAMQTAIKSLEGGQASTKKDVDQLKTDCGQLTSDMAQVQGNLKSVDRLTSDMAQVQGKLKSVDRLTSDMAQVQGKLKSVDRLTSDMAQVQGKLKSVDRLTSDMAKIQGKLSNLESRFATANTQVGFSAQLGQRVTTSRKAQTLICDRVGTNEGGRYHGGTGVFTAPVTGTYLFLTRLSPGDPGGEKAAVLDIVLDGVVKGGLSSKGMSCSTGHRVVKMTSGQKMWLRTRSDGEYTFGGGWTKFSGMLLQAEV